VLLKGERELWEKKKSVDRNEVAARCKEATDHRALDGDDNDDDGGVLSKCHYSNRQDIL
jgi:hypothetical protein